MGAQRWGRWQVAAASANNQLAACAALSLLLVVLREHRADACTLAHCCRALACVAENKDAALLAADLHGMLEAVVASEHEGAPG
jgi:hypothetical protein